MTINNANTPAASTVTVEQHPAWLTQEMWDGLSKKTIGLDTLKPEQQEEFSSFLSKVTTGEASVPTAPAAAPATPAPSGTPAAPASPAAAAPAAGDPQSPNDIPLASPEKREEFFRRFREKSAEANTVTQLKGELQKMKSEFSTKMAELGKRQITPGNPDDPLDPASVRSMGDQLKLLQERLDLALGVMGKQTEALESFHSQGAATLNEQAAILGLERFQYDTAVSDLVPPALSLQTSVPLPMLNAELATFAQKVGGLENVNKYLSDPAYKAQVEAAGAKLSDGFIKNLDKFNLIFQLNEEVKAGKYPDPMAAYSHHLITSGKLATALRDSKLAGANAVATGVANNNNATPMLNPGQDGTPLAVGWTRKAALDWVRAHPEIKPGSQDEKTFQEIEKLMNAGQLR